MSQVQQQQVVNAMLQQLPQQQRSQIEQAVNNYRQGLVQQGYGNDTVQSYVWTYYTQCVQNMYQDQSKNHPTPSQVDQSQQAQAQQAQQAQQEAQQVQMARQNQESGSLLSGSLGGSSPGLLSGSLGGSSAGLLSGNLGGSSVGGLSARQEAGQFQGQRTAGMNSQACGGTSMAGMQGMGGNMGNMSGGMNNMGGGMNNMGGGMNNMGGGMGMGGMGGMRPSMGNMGNMNMGGSMGMARRMSMGKGGMGGMGMGSMGMDMGKGGMGEDKMDMGMMGPMSKGMGKMGKGKASMDANGCQGKAMGTPNRPPVMMLRGQTPAQRMQMQQAQQQERMQGWPCGACGGRPRPPGTQTALRPSSVPNPAAGAAALGAGPKFPPGLQIWLQRLFVHVGNSDPNLQKETNAYLRYYVQTWMKSGELWQRNWEVYQLPSVEEIRKKLPPGSLAAGATGSQVQQAWPKAPGEAARPFDRRLSKGSPNRSRSQRRGSPFRSRRQRSSSSTRSSRSRRRPRSSRSRSRSGSSDRWHRGKGKGKDRGKDKGKVDKKKEMEEQREKIRLWLNERLATSGQHVRPKDLTDEMQNSFGVKPGRFRQLFNQTLQQYVNAYLSSGAEAAWPSGDNGQFSSRTVGEDRDMRAQRAARFSSHLEKSAPVSMVSLADAEVPNIDGGPIIGELHDMCSREEAKEREMTRQLDKFEWKKGTDAKNPEVNLKFATKKYQRSSADKAYRSQDVRSLEACWKTMEYLMTEILDFDCNPKAGYAVQAIPYIEVYSFLRDRTRAIRVDLHLQQPRSTTQRVFVETHECCLRFEMLSLFLLLGRGQKSAEQATEKYDTKLGLKAISQTIEPLLSAYQAIHERQLAKSILAEAMGGFGLDDDDEDYSSPFEMATRRYIVLLLMSFSPDAVSGHLAKMSRELLMHPLLTFATQVYAAFHTEDYARFLRMYREADFLTSVCMSGVADLARLRALWLLVRSYPQQVGDKISLSKIKNILAFASDDHAKAFLAFHGLQIVIDKEASGGANILLPKKGTKEAQNLPLLQGRLPEKCEFPKGADSLLVAKFDSLGLSRADIALGAADPVIPDAPEIEVEADGQEVAMDQEPGGAELTVVA